MAVPSSVGDIKYRGPLGRILHSNRCHPLKIKVFFLFCFFLERIIALDFGRRKRKSVLCVPWQMKKNNNNSMIFHII